MRSLILMRHAKSDWSDEGLPDHDRPLAPRGRRAAPLIGAMLAERLPPPELVLCSTAVRARQTLALVLAAAVTRGGWPVLPSILYEPGLYLCGGEELVARVAAVAPAVQRLMLVGHNPDMHEASLGLAQSGAAETRARLAERFPTGAAALFSLPDQGWDVTKGGRLDAFLTPRDIDD